MVESKPEAQAAGKSRKAAIPFTNFAIVDQVPARIAEGEPFDKKDPAQAIQLGEHLFPYEGCSMDRAKFIWGVYGTMSQGHALFMAGAEAAKRKCKTLVIQGSYKLENFDLVRTLVDREMMLSTGYMHIDRLKTQLRDEVKEQVLVAAKKRYPGIDIDEQAKKTLATIVCDYPGLVRDIFDLYKKVNMVVHLTKPSWAPKERRGIYVSTMRRVASRIQNVDVRFMPGVQVNIAG
jgi:hypothetical protein